ncbi:ATP-binding cassette domain-containing protein [Synechococcus sp. A10-1-5-1]|uniref:ABC transporter ATP-binding protein n=1 Tax=Synechococcus sp. A10-1-5-1 TaxID=2936507 RepID=UPI002001C64E|nr:ATP-binding cassette domain-containing protein [Synechococcus sp. A10-1-5-1]UPM50582.1 ATP-binding cassette domain-containing protein [Synechococcus sp. A10-1-5-1]
MVAVPYFEAIAVEAWLGSRRIFDGLNLTLRLGEPTVLLGPNGAGKSTLIKLISRSLYPVVKPGSSLHIFGSSTVNLWALRQRIGFVSSDLQAGYIPSVSAEEVVLSGLFGSIGLGRPQQPNRQQWEQAFNQLEAIGLADLCGRPFGECSDGQRRRLLLGRALIHRPEVLVLDEPTNGLDFKAKHQLLETLRTLSQQGTTLLLVTHQLDAVIPEIQRAVLIKQGSIVADGAAADRLTSKGLSDCFETPIAVLQQGGWRQAVPQSKPLGIKP